MKTKQCTTKSYLCRDLSSTTSYPSPSPLSVRRPRLIAYQIRPRQTHSRFPAPPPRSSPSICRPRSRPRLMAYQIRPRQAHVCSPTSTPSSHDFISSLTKPGKILIMSAVSSHCIPCIKVSLYTLFALCFNTMSPSAFALDTMRKIFIGKFWPGLLNLEYICSSVFRFHHGAICTITDASGIFSPVPPVPGVNRSVVEPMWC